MNVTSFVQLDDILAFNPGYITRVQFGHERKTVIRVTISFVDGTSFTLINKQLTKFLDWWNNQAIVMTNDAQDGDSLYFVRGQQVPEAPET